MTIVRKKTEGLVIANNVGRNLPKPISTVNNF